MTRQEIYKRAMKFAEGQRRPIYSVSGLTNVLADFGEGLLEVVKAGKVEQRKALDIPRKFDHANPNSLNRAKGGMKL